MNFRRDLRWVDRRHVHMMLSRSKISERCDFRPTGPFRTRAVNPFNSANLSRDQSMQLEPISKKIPSQPEAGRRIIVFVLSQSTEPVIAVSWRGRWSFVAHE